MGNSASGPFASAAAENLKKSNWLRSHHTDSHEYIVIILLIIILLVGAGYLYYYISKRDKRKNENRNGT